MKTKRVPVNHLKRDYFTSLLYGQLKKTFTNNGIGWSVAGDANGLGTVRVDLGRLPAQIWIGGTHDPLMGAGPSPAEPAGQIGVFAVGLRKAKKNQHRTDRNRYRNLADPVYVTIGESDYPTATAEIAAVAAAVVAMADRIHAVVAAIRAAETALDDMRCRLTV